MLRSVRTVSLADGRRLFPKDDSASEFAIYDSVLHELSAKSQNVPLGAEADGSNSVASVVDSEGEDQEGGEAPDAGPSQANAAHRRLTSHAFQVGSSAAPTRQTGPRSPEYARVLERYLSNT